MSNALWAYFYKGEKQNNTHFHTYCKACVKRHMEDAGSPITDILTQGQSFRDACTAVRHTRSEKLAWIAHQIGGKSECGNASAEAKAEARAQREATNKKKRPRPATLDTTEPQPKKHQPAQTQSTLTTYRKNDMPYAASEVAAVRRQALRAIVSGGLPLGAFREPEMLILFGMLRSTAPEIMPTGKVVGGRLLNEAAEEVDAKTVRALNDQNTGLSTALCELFEDMIDRVKKKYNCKIRYFTTDADGGSKKGRLNLGKKRQWLILPSCWAHQCQLILGDYFKVHDMAAAIAEDATGLISWLNNHGKVRKIFDKSQKIISMQNVGRMIILAYLIANLTRWTTHFVAFWRLFILKEPIQLAVYQNRKAIIDAQVGTAVSMEGERLRADAENDLESICLATNINQQDSTRPDQVLLTITGIFLRFADHAEEEVKTAMLIRLEKRWKDCDQPVFLVALILNPFEKMACFGPNTNFNQIKCLNMVLLLYRRVMDRPDNTDTKEERKVKEAQVSKVFVQYLAGRADFGDFDGKEWEEIHENVDPVMVWQALAGSSDIMELACFAIIILQVVVNQAGCERTFSWTKIEQSDHRVRLGLPKIEKRTKIRAEIRSEHIKQGLYKPRKPRQNHKSTATLLSVPRYQDLLGDQGDEDPTWVFKRELG
ncbi:ribonuclease H-like domain-containing protein [Mycena sp. CBHHK59/15]|nr:ribonuclease H-like domain-containing protein [Mycena sp. CBHHK59/15]